MRHPFPTALACCILAFAAPASLLAGVELTVTIGPPPIPVYAQPIPPQDGFAWTPGYWAYGDAGYFWVPGTWLMPPTVGLLWTPGYWGWGNQAYVFHEGYWGPQVGFYGGVNYGYGYGGSGFQGGYWQGQTYYYNRSVTHLGSAGFAHVYDKPVAHNPSHVAFNGGRGGLRAAPTGQDREAEHERHVPPTGEQAQHRLGAQQNKTLLASANHGRPPIGATAKPGDFTPAHSAPAQAVGRAGHSAQARAQVPNRVEPGRSLPPASRPEPARVPHASPAPRPQPVRAAAPVPRPDPPRPSHQERPEPVREAPAQSRPQPARNQVPRLDPPRPQAPQQHEQARPAPQREEHPK